MNGLDDAARSLLGAGLAGLGAVLLLIGAVGALRFADVYERIHAIRAGAAGAPLALAGFAVWSWDAGIAVRLAFVAIAMALTGPAIAHLIAHAAHRGGVEPEARARARAERAR